MTAGKRKVMVFERIRKDVTAFGGLCSVRTNALANKITVKIKQ